MNSRIENICQCFIEIIPEIDRICVAENTGIKGLRFFDICSTQSKFQLYYTGSAPVNGFIVKFSSINPNACVIINGYAIPMEIAFASNIQD